MEVSENKTQAVEKMDKLEKKQNKKEKQQGNESVIDKVSKDEAKIDTTEICARETTSSTVELKEETLERTKKEIEYLKRKQLNRQFRKILQKEKGDRCNVKPIIPNKIELRSKIDEIKSREVLSKRAKRKLAILEKKLKVEESTGKLEKLDATEKKDGKFEGNARDKQKAEKNVMKRKKKRNKEDKLKKEDSLTEKNDKVQNDAKGFTKIVKKQIDEEEKKRDDNTEKMEEAADKIPNNYKKQKTRKKRYVLFVGNLPYK